MKISVISPEKIVYCGHVDRAIMPGVKGEFTILDRHALTLASLKPGIISLYEKQRLLHQFSISGGYVDVTPEESLVLVDAIETEEHLEK